MKRLVTTRTCPSCELVKLDFEQNLNRFRQPVGGITAWCWICSRGYYLAGNQIRDISVRCARLEVTAPAHYCPTCPVSDACLKELEKRGV